MFSIVTIKVNVSLTYTNASKTYLESITNQHIAVTSINTTHIKSDAFTMRRCACTTFLLLIGDSTISGIKLYGKATELTQAIEHEKSRFVTLLHMT